MRHWVLLAQDDGSIWGFWNSPASGVREILLILGFLCVITLVGILWAAFLRKPRKRRHSYHHLHSSDDSNGGLPERRKRRSGIARLFGRKRHRTHSRRERPVNPTLAQVGGLPPQRRDPPRDS